MSPVLVLLIGVLAFGSSPAEGLGCLNEKDGSAVDWWFIYKQPGGTQFAYLDADGTTSDFTFDPSAFLNRSTDGALGSTLAQLYAGKKTLAYVVWNDENIDGQDDVADTCAHSKGVLASNGDTGFWLVHSVPKFPDLTLSKFAWTASTTYGQSLLCISQDSENSEAVSELLQYANIGKLQSNMPKKLKSKLSSMNDLISGKTKEGASYIEWESLGGVQFTSFYKSESWGKDLYEDLVSPTLELPFLWETWRRKPASPSYCKGPKYDYDSLNVETMDFTKYGGTEFSYTKDHSKVGVAIDPSNPWVCVGGINRMDSQWNRGGGTSCFVDENLYDALKGVIAEADSCSKGKVIVPAGVPVNDLEFADWV